MRAHTFVAFDIDNTLLDPDMRAYRDTVTDFLKSADIGHTPHEGFGAYEQMRAGGHALQRLGLMNPIHDRGNPEGLAVFWLISCTNPNQRRELGITETEQDEFRRALSELVQLDQQTRNGSYESRLNAELKARWFCRSNERIHRLRTEAVRLAGHTLIVESAQRYKSIENAQPAESRMEFMETLATRGLYPIIITEGRVGIQVEKLSRIGLPASPPAQAEVVGNSWADRVLITEEAADVSGAHELRQAVSCLLDNFAERRSESTNSEHSPSTELTYLWHYQCLIDEWAGKTPSFFARCLHAIQHSPEAPRKVIQLPIFVPRKDWQPMRFVMVGDRYDKDVEPLIDLLGPGVGMKIRLRMGKYGHLHTVSSLDSARRPDRMFTDWESLAHFMTEELTPEQVEPITTPPDIADQQFVTRELVEFGLQCELEAVRIVAAALEKMTADSASSPAMLCTRDRE